MLVGCSGFRTLLRPMIELAKKSTLDPRTGKYFAFSDSFVPDPGNYRKDLWSQVGFPNGPDSWDDLHKGGHDPKSHERAMSERT